jgi:hypothetical protein
VQHDLVAGKTPGSALPLLISPAGSDEPGATPLQDSTISRLGPLSRAGVLHSGSSLVQQWGARSRGLQPMRLARLALTNAALSQQDLVCCNKNCEVCLRRIMRKCSTADFGRVGQADAEAWTIPSHLRPSSAMCDGLDGIRNRRHKLAPFIG